MIARRTYKLLYTISFCVMSFFFFTNVALAQLDPAFKEIQPQFAIPIPTLTPFTPIAQPDASGIISVRYLGEYIEGVYRYAVGIAGIFAVALIMWGGMKWVFAGGDTGKIGEAKKTINNAVIGLVLVLGSYLLLYTINPATTEFKALKLTTVSPEYLEEDPHTSEDDPLTAARGALPAAKYPSDRALAQRDRSVSVDFSLFGVLDYAANVGGKRELRDIRLIVIHNGGYSAKMNHDTWISNWFRKGAKTCAHYTIERSGKIFQHCGEELRTVHGNRFNRDGIGIEINIGKAAGTSCNSLKGAKATAANVREACTPTDAQYTALSGLINDIIRRTSVQKNIRQIVGHCESGSGGHADPRAFDWSRVGLNNQQKKDSLKTFPNACSWYLPF